MLLCSLCAKEFKYESERKRHEQSHFPQFECKQCLKKFSFLSALRRHQKQHERVGSVECDECGRSFRDDTLLLRHIKYAHTGTFYCSKCNEKFHSQLALNSHLKSHKKKSERRYQCSYDGCNKSFNFMHHLKHHVLTHTDTKMHHCRECNKGFIQAHHLKTHMKTHDPENWFHCHKLNCKKSFPTEYGLKKHLSTHKNTTDSGISSDSSSDVHHDFNNDKILCTSCGELVLKVSYDKHEQNCVPYLEDQSTSSTEDPFKDFGNNVNISKNDEFKLWINGKSSSDIDINRNVNKAKEEKACLDKLLEVQINACEGCCCKDSNTSNANITAKPVFDINAPKIEYKTDGTVKIKETCDLEFRDIVPPKKTKSVETNNNFNFIPFNSCKDVLGKCIVSGNGTISEECLCARMAIDDQPMIEQEIDEITPYPAMTLH